MISHSVIPAKAGIHPFLFITQKKDGSPPKTAGMTDGHHFLGPHGIQSGGVSLEERTSTWTWRTVDWG